MQEISNELLHRQVIAIHVTKRQSNARDTDLAELAGRNGLVLVRIEDDDRISRERYADRDRLVRPQLGHCRRDGRLGGAVSVENAAAGAIPSGHEILQASLAADQQDPQVRHVLLDGGEQRRTTSHRGHTEFAQKVAELVAHQGRAGRARHERRAGHQRHPDLLDGEIERDRHALIDAIAGCIAIKLGGDAHEIANACVSDTNALRITGGARCVDDVAERLDRRRNAGQRIGRLRIDRWPLRIEKYLVDLEAGEALRETRH